MSPARILAYARLAVATSIVSPRRWVELVAFASPWFLLMSSPLPRGVVIYGAISMARLPTLFALAAPRRGDGPPQGGEALPTLPILPLERSLAAFLLALVHLVPGCLVGAAVGVPIGTIAGRLVVAVGALSWWAAWTRIAEVRLANHPRARLFTALGLLVIPVVASAELPFVPLACGIALLGVAAWLDRAPGIGNPSVAPSGELRLVYVPAVFDRPEDRSPTGALEPEAAIRRLGRSRVIRLGARDGLLVGLVALVVIFCGRMLSGGDPAGDLEEALASARLGLSDQLGWQLVFALSTGVTALVGIRPVVLPGHSRFPDDRANVLAPLRWLPVSGRTVWRTAGWTAVMGWWATWAAAMGVLAVPLACLRDILAFNLISEGIGVLLLGTGLTLIAQGRGPLRVLAHGVAPASVGSLLLNYGITVIAMFGLLWGASPLASPTLGGWSLLPLGFGATVCGGAVAWFRARMPPEPIPMHAARVATR